MTGAGRLPSPGNPIANIAKVLIAVGAITVGLFVFAVSATFLLVAVLAVAFVALLAISFFWARARLTGRPFGPREQFEAMFAEMHVEMAQPSLEPEGVVLDAHKTPDGWSVDR